MVRSGVLLLMLACVAQAGAVTLRLCVDERPIPPYTSPDGGGLVIQLIREAAQENGIVVETYAAPLTRCREEIRINGADGYPSAPYTPALQSFMAFPMRGAEPDAARSIMSARSMVYRRPGSAAHWDGTRFTHLATPVLVRFGSVRMIDKLVAMGVPTDDSGKTLEANFTKLLAGRADLALGLEMTAQSLLAQPGMAGKIETLPLPFSDEVYFLGLSKAFYHAHPQLSERLWDAIARIRRSPAYQRSLRKALEDAPAARRD